MNNEKALANDHALSAYAVQILPEFRNTISVVKNHFNNPNEDTVADVRNYAISIRSLYRLIDDYSKAMADLKAKMDFVVCDLIGESPELQGEFRLQPGAKSIKCDAQGTSMRLLMDRFVAEGYDPAALFEKCGAITAKKAAEAFGLSEQALLESHGDLFATHENRPSVRMI